MNSPLPSLCTVHAIPPHTYTPIIKLRVAVLEERAPPFSLSLSLACGLQYGLARLPPCPEEVGTHWPPSRCSPSRPHTYIWTHTNTETHKLVDRLTAPAPTTPHPAGRWPMDRGHVAGRNASRCWALAPTDLVPVSLPANYQPGTPHKNREGVLFSTLLIAAIALLSAPLGFWPLLLFLLAFLVSYGSSWLQNPFFFLLLVLFLLQLCCSFC